MEIPKWWHSDKPYRITDVMDGLKSLPDGVIQCVVTSPPYWGLRDYGTGTWEGGDPNCDHKKGTEKARSRDKSTIGYAESQGHNLEGWGDYCRKCGAVRVDKQIGLESTPDEYVKKLVEVFREVRRVLRDDGTFWLNIGDSYAGGGGASGIPDDWESISMNNRDKFPVENDPKRNAKKLGLKPKDLVGVPWRLAFALQQDGWYLRSDIIWSKPNPMPESVTDRPTKSHEYIFLLTKSSRYFYDAHAIREKGTIPAGTKAAKGSEERFNTDKVNSRPPEYKEYDGMRNKRSVWTITTKPYAEAHFATFPPELPEFCIKAGTSQKGCCSKCGKPWERVVDKESKFTRPDNSSKYGIPEEDIRGGRETLRKRQINNYTTVGWVPVCDCDCGLRPEPCIVLDPFLGSGTTAMVARDLNRVGLGFDLNPDYQPIIKKRMGGIEGFGENYVAVDNWEGMVREHVDEDVT